MSKQQKSKWKSVFLSYHHKDETLATYLYQFLKSIGVDVWFAPVHSDPNLDRSSLRRNLEHDIKKRDLMLLLVTKNSLQSWWIEQETNIVGFSEGEEDAKRKLLFVTFIEESKNKDLLKSMLSDTALSRFNRCDLLSLDLLEEASERCLLWFLGADEGS
ncbi:MAG: toll/interleukin-1 receptor domain-containing protein [Halobacteriota archaeon]